MRNIAISLLLCGILIASGQCLMRSADCQIPDRQNVSAPVLATPDKLNFENCGAWDHTTNQETPKMPWRVAIFDPANLTDPGDRCFGVLISATTVLSNICDVPRNTNVSSQKAFVGECFENFTSPEECQAGHKGQVLEVEDFRKLSITNVGTVYMWTIKEANLKEKVIWPICLFNGDNKDDFLPDQHFLTYDVETSWRAPATLVANITSCLPLIIENERCASLNTSLCSEQASLGWAPFLIKEQSHRWYVRGLKDYAGNEATLDIYSDALYHLEAIVPNSTLPTKNDTVPSPASP